MCCFVNIIFLIFCYRSIPLSIHQRLVISYYCLLSLGDIVHTNSSINRIGKLYITHAVTLKVQCRPALPIE